MNIVMYIGAPMRQMVCVKNERVLKWDDVNLVLYRSIRIRQTTYTKSELNPSVWDSVNVIMFINRPIPTRQL